MWRDFLKRIHPEGIPWPGSVLYNALSRSRIFQQHYRLLAEDIAAHCQEGSILDIGTGPARLLFCLHEVWPHVRLVGVDVSPAMARKARENLSRAGLSKVIHIQAAAAQHLPFADESFHTVVSSGTVHHWKDPVAGLNEVYRVLRAGGWGLMYDLVKDTPAEVLRHLTQEHGRFRVRLLRLHSLEEPFHTVSDFASLAGATPFRTGQVRFVGALCCLALARMAPPPEAHADRVQGADPCRRRQPDDDGRF
ncbi:MAG: class I SAM-dependent methyltransferase [Phycisphaerae bacterium]|jgi:ubiquinone/menaquinone biosynthesis C-methylase UbiE|nr:class I SAM-dependent methyltransferase [Phycisphaerae bacterium]